MLWIVKKDADDFSDEQTLAGIARQVNRGKKLKKPIIPPNTKTLEREYFSSLRKMVALMARLVKELVMPQIPSILSSAEQLRPKVDRKDNFSDEIDQAMTTLRLEFQKNVSDPDRIEMAEAAANSVNSQNSRYYDRLSKQATGISVIRVEPWLEAEITGFVRANTSLIKSVSDQYFEKIEGIVTRGAQTGKQTKDITTQIRATTKVSERKAALIARDQISKFNGNLNKLRQQTYGIKKYQWQTSEDERVRDEHESLNGTIRSWDESPIPGEEVNCRCVAIPVFE